MKDGYYKIRTWGSMLAEYGFEDDDEDTIDCRYTFNENMENDLPPDRIIHIVRSDVWLGNTSNWNVSDDMIELYLGPNRTSPSLKHLKRK